MDRIKSWHSKYSCTRNRRIRIWNISLSYRNWPFQNYQRSPGSRKQRLVQSKRRVRNAFRMQRTFSIFSLVRHGSYNSWSSCGRERLCSCGRVRCVGCKYWCCISSRNLGTGCNGRNLWLFYEFVSLSAQNREIIMQFLFVRFLILAEQSLATVFKSVSGISGNPQPAWSDLLIPAQLLASDVKAIRHWYAIFRVPRDVVCRC